MKLAAKPLSQSYVPLIFAEREKSSREHWELNFETATLVFKP